MHLTTRRKGGVRCLEGRSTVDLVKRTPLELAAIASAAVPGLAPTGVAGTPDDAADFESALLVDDSGKQWRVRSPKHPEASMRLETELQALRAFSPAVKAELPFLIPHIAGSVRQGELSTFVYSHLTGTARPLDALAAGGQSMAEELGRTLAAIHELPKDMVLRADLPSYEANEYRQRKLNELDQAATTGRVPPVLLRRWEHALEDVALWRFTPTVVHGDLHEDHLLITAGRVSAVTGWTDLSIGDPAADFAWLAAVEDPTFVDAVHASYAGERGTVNDPHLARRAALAAEFALAQWLVRGVALDDADMIAEADSMLATLRVDVERIEQEQHEAAERARLAYEEQLEWGTATGTDPANDAVEDSDAGSDTSEADEYTGAEDTHDGAPGAARMDAFPTTSDDEARHTTPGTVSPTQNRPGNGSHAVINSSGDDEGDLGGITASRKVGNHLRDETEVHAEDRNEGRSGSSLAYARLTAGRGTGASTSGASGSTAPGAGKVTVLRTNPQDAGSSDDLATSALPVISYGR